MQHLFARVFGSDSLLETFSADTTVTDSNMMTFLGMIEEKTNELLQVPRQSGVFTRSLYFLSACPRHFVLIHVRAIVSS